MRLKGKLLRRRQSPLARESSHSGNSGQVLSVHALLPCHARKRATLSRGEKSWVRRLQSRFLPPLCFAWLSQPHAAVLKDQVARDWCWPVWTCPRSVL